MQKDGSTTTRIWLLRALLIFGAIGISGCHVLIRREEIPPTPPPERWFADDDPACMSPCAFGITPGVTEVSDALTILDGIVWIEKDSIRRRSVDTYVFNFQPDGIGYLEFENSVVSSLKFVIAGELLLSEVLERLGPPRWVAVELQDLQRRYDALPIFPENGVLLDAWSEYGMEEHYQSGTAAEAYVHPEMPINVIWFYPVSDGASAQEVLSDGLGADLWTTTFEGQRFQKWSGYGIYRPLVR